MNPAQTRPSVLKPLFFVLRVVVLAACCAGCTGGGSEPPVSRFPEAARLAAQGKLTEARRIAEAIPSSDRNFSPAQFLLGNLAMSEQRIDEAIAHFDAISESGSETSLKAARLCAELYLQKCQLSEAAGKYRYFVSHTGDVQARTLLASVLAIGGQRNQAEEHLMQLLKEDRLELKELVLLSTPDRLPADAKHLMQCREGETGDPLTSFAFGSKSLEHGAIADAERYLRAAVSAKPEFAEAQARLGELLLEQNPDQFRDWQATVPATISTHPDLWFVRGLHALTLSEDRVAARCFWETLRTRPLHRRALYNLGHCLAAENPEFSQHCLRRAAELAEFSELLERVLISRGDNADDSLRLITLLADSGRLWEARAWGLRLQNEKVRAGISKELQQAFAALKGSPGTRFTDSAFLTSEMDLSAYPAQPESPEGIVADAPNGTAATPVAAIEFRSDAERTGLKFQYFHSLYQDAGEVRIFESTGGGVGVVDFERDGRPDLFVTQGEPWPLGQDIPEDSPEFVDGLYRNDGTRFLNVSPLTGISPEGAYGQGCSVGDFNNDGFSDLYVGNIGRNRLLQNLGDGTFEDVTAEAGLTADAWTTSCLLLDLNQDGAPDLYDVNYLQGTDVYRVQCGHNRCSVRSFEGAKDLISLSDGAGHFHPAPDIVCSTSPKGLGIAALHPSPTAPPWLFIANDQVPNYFLRPEPGNLWVDEAVSRGVAVNQEGKPTACMGVAIGDVNGDRMTDLFVTNFENEANCLYRQQGENFFVDAVAGTGLQNPGIPWVGWGTQFLDAENDGDLDLAITNGHVADFHEHGVNYAMPVQVFCQENAGRFRLELPSANDTVLGSRMLGRALAVWDWNLDGHQDFCVSAISSPLLLATNHTKNCGHWLSVGLWAVNSPRDAVGAIVEIQCRDRKFWKQLNAGDGFQCTNERRIHFGLGSANEIEQILVSWPSGNQSEYRGVSVDQRIEIVENHDSIVTLPH